VLEDFFSFDAKKFDEFGYGQEIKSLLFNLLDHYWQNSKKELDLLGLEGSQLNHYYEESKTMLSLWAERFIKKLELESIGLGVVTAFERLRPRTEVEYNSENYGVKGYVDAVHEHDEIILMDYKTSNKDYVQDEYRLQLGIYALLYQQEHGIAPDKVGIDFLRFGEIVINVDENLLNLAKKEIEAIHGHSKSDRIEDYPKTPSKLCNWCDFYSVCFSNEVCPY
jgi:CRISPR/Cas system-associated exonuclease Cas4 (RecB family)